MLASADYEEIKAIVNGWLRDVKPVVLDVKVIEDTQATRPLDEINVEPEEASEDQPVEAPEDQQPPEAPEA